MRIGVFRNSWWAAAARARGIEVIELPFAPHPSNNAYASDLAARRLLGEQLYETLKDDPPDLLMDNGGTGLLFVPGKNGPNDVNLLHEALGIPLISHFIDPLITALQGLPWPVVWQSLYSTTWYKAIWDLGQVRELVRWSIPSVGHLPMAAPIREYPSEPLDPDAMTLNVSFVGGQNTSYYYPERCTRGPSLVPATVVQGVRSDLPQMTFADVYYDLYQWADPIHPNEPPTTQYKKSAEYFDKKIAYHAALALRNRDRFAIFLKKQLGDQFELHGTRWDTAYGLPCDPQLPSGDAYFDHFRHTAINLNLVNGNAETGLNMRHFEITAAGGFMLCYPQPELANHFEVGKECAVFTDERDLLRKIEYFLSHPEERLEIAAAGQRRTLENHLYLNRFDTALEAIGAPSGAVEGAADGVAQNQNAGCPVS
jgi:hypothetical protein